MCAASMRALQAKAQQRGSFFHSFALSLPNSKRCHLTFFKYFIFQLNFLAFYAVFVFKLFFFVFAFFLNNFCNFHFIAPKNASNGMACVHSLTHMPAASRARVCVCWSACSASQSLMLKFVAIRDVFAVLSSRCLHTVFILFTHTHP